MNTPQQQAELYRKAAETIEMCAPHGIEPMVKNNKHLFNITRNSIGYVGDFEEYEFPLAVIEGQLVWKGDKLYYNDGEEWFPVLSSQIFSCSSWTPPKQPLCEVEGKPVYKGDKLWFIGSENVKAREITVENYRDDIRKLQATDTGLFEPSVCSWNPPKQTVMVELTVEDAEMLIGCMLRHSEIAKSCRKALDNLK